MRPEDLVHHRGVPAVREHPADVGERQADPPQPGDQPGGDDLVVAVPAVAAPRVHPGRYEHSGAVVEPQGADGEPGLPGHLTDPPHVFLHMDDRPASTGSRVKHSPASASSSACAMCASSRQIRARMTAEPTKANQNGPVMPQIRAMTPPSAWPATMPPKTPIE